MKNQQLDSLKLNDKDDEAEENEESETEVEHKPTSHEDTPSTQEFFELEIGIAKVRIGSCKFDAIQLMNASLNLIKVIKKENGNTKTTYTN